MYWKNHVITQISYSAMQSVTAIFVQQPHKPEAKSFSSRRKDNGTWYNVSSPQELYVYSAFYDDRPSLGTHPVVRIIAVTEVKDKDPVFCQLYYGNNHTSGLIKVHKDSIGFGVSRHGKVLKEFVFGCPLSNSDVPVAVSILQNGSHVATNRVPVELPAKPKTKGDFAVCVSVCYGQQWDLYKLVEWMELVKILGVTKVGIYNNTLDQKTASLFQHYDKTGFVDFRQSWNFIPDPGSLTSHLHWSPVINDCMYRFMYSYHHIIVMDLDEVIIPKNVANYSQLLKQIDEKQVKSHHPARHYTFRNAYFFKDIPKNDTSLAKYFTILKHRWRLPPSDPGYSVKSIISPMSCTHMHNHYCWGSTKLHDTSGLKVDVELQYAMNQHYKMCHFSKEECKKVIAQAVPDDVILRYNSSLMQNVHDQLKKLQLLT